MTTVHTNKNHKQLVAEAKKRIKEYEAKTKQHVQEEIAHEFAKIGPYIPSEATKEQLRRLAKIQEEANKMAFDYELRF